jgi:Brp/Blh family beta-carotene 15,15'-monooxygenase
MQAQVYMLICLATVASIALLGRPDLTLMVIGCGVAVALLGVPHGGLDHWPGQRLLRRWFGNRWWLVFFPSYLLVASLVVAAWVWIPVIAVPAFFVASAWHFGREDQQASRPAEVADPPSNWFRQCAAVAVGGLVIWIPALLRPSELMLLLEMINTRNEPAIVWMIVQVTQIIAAAMLPIAAAVIASQILRNPFSSTVWVPLSTVMIAICTPILVAFTLYFCGWHSWQGLVRLRRDADLKVGEFIFQIAPLSFLAVLGVMVVGLWLQGPATDALLEEHSIWLRLTFIGLAAIAIPHVIVHEWDGFCPPAEITAEAS